MHLRPVFEGSSVLESSVRIASEFRRHCLSMGMKEADRVPLASHHDPSIRFTNSTISVLKPRLLGERTPPTFLVQPALRLRNLDHWKATGTMSGFGCYFMSFGAIAPPSSLELFHAAVTDLFTESMGVDPQRLVWKYSATDPDLSSAVLNLNTPSEADGYELRRFRHVFGLPHITGRNSNLAVQTPDGPRDVGNVIVIEREGEPIGVEMAFGISNIVAQATGLPHPVHGSTAHDVLRQHDLPKELNSEMAADALGSAVALSLDALRPSGRGRGRNFRDFLQVLVPWAGFSELEHAVANAVDAETTLRAAASPANEFTDLESCAAREVILQEIHRLAARASRNAERPESTP